MIEQILNDNLEYLFCCVFQIQNKHKYKILFFNLRYYYVQCYVMIMETVCIPVKAS